MTHWKKSENGFTLLEILVSMFIFTGVVLAITSLALDFAGYGIFFGESLEVQEELTKTAKTMETELRGMGPAINGAYQIQVAAGNTITFYSDYNLDGQAEQIRYFLNGGTLMRGVTHPSGNPLQYPAAQEKTTEVVHNVISNPSTIFTYYGSGYSGTEAPLASPVNVSNIRLIVVTITSDKQAKGGSGPATEILKVAVRSLRIQ